MDIQNKHILLTGAASGIGKALAKAFLEKKAKKIMLVDMNKEPLDALTQALMATFKVEILSCVCNVGHKKNMKACVKQTIDAFGSVDLVCLNAGIARGDGLDATDKDWKDSLNVHLYAHLYAMQEIIPHFLTQKHGYILHTASAAGLLTELHSLPYSVSKHTTVALAEWLHITYAKDNIKSSVLCPQAVATPMIGMAQETDIAAGVDGIMSPESVADCVIKGLKDESFLILPHPEVLRYFQRKASDYDRWLKGMTRLRETLNL